MNINLTTGAAVRVSSMLLLEGSSVRPESYKKKREKEKCLGTIPIPSGIRLALLKPGGDVTAVQFRELLKTKAGRKAWLFT